MLRIAVVTRYFPSSAEPWQGRSAYQTLKVMARSCDVQVFYPNATYPSWVKPSRRKYETLDNSFRTPDVKVSYHEYPALPVLSRPFNGWMAARALLPHVQAFSPDLVFSYFVYPEGFAAAQIAKCLGVPMAVNAIGSDINNIGAWFSALHTRRVLREADFVCTVSDDLRTKAVSLGSSPDRTRTVHNGCDLSVFRPLDRIQARETLHIDTAAEVIVYIGRIDVKKGLRELVDATTSLHPHHPRLLVYMVGDGPDRPLIREAVLAANIEAYVHLPGPCSPGDVATWMAAADLVTLPSYMEGCPNVVIEALACGRPVVATHVGGVPELLNDDWLVPPRDANALAIALAAVLREEWDASSISGKLNRSWEDVAGELLSQFEALVAARPVPDQAQPARPGRA